MTAPTAVDLFAGCGGGSIGLQRAGFDVIGAVDVDDAAVETYWDNPVDVEPWQADLTKVEFSDIADHYGFDVDDVDLVMGCPPCQNFSSLRDTTPWPGDEPKDELLRAFVKHVEQADPTYVLFENVRGIFTADGGVYLQWLLDRMDDLGYGKDVDVLDAADYGVPQHRERTIGLFEKGVDDEDVQIPERTHAPLEEVLSPYQTVDDAIGELLPLGPGESCDTDPAHRARNHQESTLEIIRAVPKNGGSRTDIEDEDLILECHEKLEEETSAGNVYGRMEWDSPAPTLTTRCTVPSCGRFIHPWADRAITFREAARLMSLPDFELPSKNADAERVVGNAVPTKFVQSISERIIA